MMSVSEKGGGDLTVYTIGEGQKFGGRTVGGGVRGDGIMYRVVGNRYFQLHRTVRALSDSLFFVR